MDVASHCQNFGRGGGPYGGLGNGIFQCARLVGKLLRKIYWEEKSRWCGGEP
jgi:hypothetical protein